MNRYSTAWTAYCRFCAESASGGGKMPVIMLDGVPCLSEDSMSNGRRGDKSALLCCLVSATASRHYTSTVGGLHVNYKSASGFLSNPGDAGHFSVCRMTMVRLLAVT
jgi:hypothetical protein